jgi:ankyrin repeat protein
MSNDFKVLKSELEKQVPDFEIVRQIVSSNKHLLNEPIDEEGGRYVLHYACEKNAPSNIVIDVINDNPTAVQQKDYNGWYPLHFACWKNQSESVIQLLVKEYPLAVRQIDNGISPLYLALSSKQSESVIMLLVKEYSLAVLGKDMLGNYPLHLACKHCNTDRVLLVLINLSLHAVKHKDHRKETPLCIAKQAGQSSTIIRILEVLEAMSNHDLENRIDIPKIVTLHALDNLQRQDTFQWLLYNSPTLIDGQYNQIM